MTARSEEPRALIRRPSHLAAFGGPPAVPRDATPARWPVVGDAERRSVTTVLDGGHLVSNTDVATEVDQLEREWAQRCGTAHCVGVSNGTAALELILDALGVGPGSEVIVPALSFIATAMAPLNLGAVPVFADVDPHTFNLSPEDTAARVTPRTAAIVPVHLHGQPADMGGLTALAQRHGVPLVEDAAQAHGAAIGDRRAGSLGNAAAFSLQYTKNLPTCGEGGLITTDDPDLARHVGMARQFGEELVLGAPRTYRSHIRGGNAKLNPVQAAFTLAQLTRFDAYREQRERNVTAFLSRLSALPGLQVPRAVPGTTHAWHILRFRFHPGPAVGAPEVDPDRFRASLHRLLRAEGVPMSRYQVMPLPDQPVFVGADDGSDSEHPDTRAVIADSLTLQKRHLDPASGPLLQHYAGAFEKVWEHLDTALRMARAR